MGNVHMEATQINYRGGSKKMSVEEAIKAAGTEITPEEKAWIDTIPELATQEIIAPEFDAEAGTYEIGDLVMYEGKLYEFTSAHETAGEWDSTEVTEKTVADEIDDVKSGLTNLAGLKFLPVTFTDTFEANSNITNGVTVSSLTGGVLTSENQIKGIIVFNGYPYFLFQLTYQGKIILGTDTARSMQETINVRMVILY